MALPKVTEVAKLWAEPELRFTPGGKAVVSVPLVFNKRKKTDDGWEDAGSLFVRGTAWEGFAENIAETFEKGDTVLVSGELSMREYEKDGQKRQSLEMAIFSMGPDVKRFSARVNRAERSSQADEGDAWSGTSTAEAPF